MPHKFNKVRSRSVGFPLESARPKKYREKRGRIPRNALVTPAPRTLSTSIPWKPHSRRYTRGIVGLHEEIEDFCAWMAPTPTEYHMRHALVHRITQVVWRKYSDAIVDCFGSFQTNLFLPSSDIDMVIFGKWPQLPLFSLQEEFVRAGICSRDPKSIKILDKAAVPIIKITEQWSNIRADISFNMVNGINGAKWINHCIARYPCLPKLVFVLKQFLQHRDLNEVFTGGISSYSLILLVISFLQLHPRYNPTDSDTNLGVMLIEFFELYGRLFNYAETSLRLRDGGAYVSKTAMERMMTGGQHPGYMSIEDPLQPGVDVARSSYGAPQVKQAFEYAYFQLSRAVMDDNNHHYAGSFLSGILMVSEETVKHRVWVAQEYSKNVPVPSQEQR